MPNLIRGHKKSSVKAGKLARMRFGRNGPMNGNSGKKVSRAAPDRRVSRQSLVGMNFGSGGPRGGGNKAVGKPTGRSRAISR